MAQEKFGIITSAEREYIWERNYHYNLSGNTDVKEEIAENPAYRKNRLFLVHPAVERFYRKHKSPFQSPITKSISQFFPPVLDLTRERSMGLSIAFPKSSDIYAVVCDDEVSKGIFKNVDNCDTFNFSYRIVPLIRGEYNLFDETDLKSIFGGYRDSGGKLDSEIKIKLRRQFAILKSFDTYLRNGLFSVKHIPVEITKRKGEIDRGSLRTYLR